MMNFALPASETETEALINMSDVLRFEKFMDFRKYSAKLIAIPPS